MSHIDTKDFLVELGTEELPPTALKKLSRAFTQGILNGLDDANLSYTKDSVESYATPRRLATMITNLQIQQSDKSIEKLGPAVTAAYDKEGNPSKAATGFARSNGVALEDLEEIETDKGMRLCYRAIEPGSSAEKILPIIIQQAIDQLPIAKRMRWGSSRTEFVRPVHWLLVLLGNKPIECEILNLSASNLSYGHRFHAPEAITIDKPTNYEKLLAEKGEVTVSFEKRKEIIIEQVTSLAQTVSGKAVIEEGLLDEVAALVEKPVALMGKFDEAFLEVPQEALIYSMSEHQKYFHIIDNQKKLLPCFVTVSNLESLDPEQIVRGNERVIRPRLADAAFFFETDKKQSLASLRERLKPIVFQQQLGTVFEKTERIAQLAGLIAEKAGADQKEAKLAGQLCKADLASDMVLEFDKMQGVAGGYYAVNDGLSSSIADAIKQHYWPKHSGDNVPTSKLACAVALADRLDTLTGIFGIGQEPTGSKDPFALRRAAIGCLQIILQQQLALDIVELIQTSVRLHASIENPEKTQQRVTDYIFDRFAAVYQDQGLPAEIFTAVRSQSVTQPLDFDARVSAVAAFVQTSESESLASSNKRVSNILEKSSAEFGELLFNESHLQEPAEKTLFSAIKQQEEVTTPMFKAREYRQGLLKLTELKPAIDAFFDEVMVNADDKKVRQNRLALLARLRQLFLQVADISTLAASKK